MDIKYSVPTFAKKIIMKLENQVCTLDQAKKLKHLGVSQSISLYAYYQDGYVEREDGVEIKSDSVGERCVMESAAKDWGEERKIFAVFTVAELFVMLPDNYQSWREEVFRKGKSYCCQNRDRNSIPAYMIHGCETQAFAAAEMLINLLTDGLCTAEEVNNRLAEA